MKNLVLGAALVGLAFGCKSNQNTAVADPSTANMPKKECTMGGKDCCNKSDGQKKACCQQQAPEQPQN